MINHLLSSSVCVAVLQLLLHCHPVLKPDRSSSCHTTEAHGGKRQCLRGGNQIVNWHILVDHVSEFTPVPGSEGDGRRSTKCERCAVKPTVHSPHPARSPGINTGVKHDLHDGCIRRYFRGRHFRRPRDRGWICSSQGSAFAVRVIQSVTSSRTREPQPSASA